MESPLYEHQFMRECPTLAFVTAFSLITNICSNVTQRRLNLQKHSVRVLEVHTSNIRQQKFFEDHYRVYDDGVEEIRNARESDGQKCDFRAYVQNSKVLNPDGWSNICVKRMNAPVPDYSDNDSGKFYYVSTERIANGDFCEKFSLKKANALSDARKTNDICPRTQLNKLLECWNTRERCL